MKLEIFVVLLMLTGCGSSGVRPRVKSAPGVSIERIHLNSVLPRLAETPPASLIQRWNIHGLAFNIDGSQYRYCGSKLKFTAPGGEVAYGRFIVFSHHPNGTGPAGRGDYIVELSGDVAGALTGGRMAMRYESYLSPQGESYAWVVILSERPLVARSDCTK